MERISYKDIYNKEIFKGFSNEDFGYYLAGLFEGDGHIWVSSKYDENYEKRNPVFCITLHKNNDYIAESLQKRIGYGWIRNKVSQNAIVFTISNEKGYLILLQLLRGKLKTPKINKVNQLIEWLNDNRGYRLDLFSYNLKKACKDLDNFWLCGFTDADGCFYIRVSKLHNKSRIAFRFSIDQRMHDPMTGESYKYIMDSVANKFNTKNNFIKRKHGTYFRLEATNKESLQNILEYFEKYPLKTIKFLDFLDWKEGILLYESRCRINDNLIKSLKKIKLRMNSLRKIL